MSTDKGGVDRLQAEFELLKQEIVSLKSQNNFPSAPVPAAPLEDSSNQPLARRRALKRLGAVLLGGAVAGAATLNLPQTAEAKFTANPTINGMSNRVGALITPPGASAPSGNLPDNAKYGLIITGETTALNLNTLPAIATNDNSYGLLAVTENGISLLGNSPDGIGVLGNTSSGYGLYGDSISGIGVRGDSSSYIGVRGASNTNIGVRGTSTSDAGVRGESSSSYGMYGTSETGIGVRGNSKDLHGLVGISENNKGVYAVSNTEYALYARGNSGDAAFFSGQVSILGSLSKSSGSFKIDHPTDPANKYLYHSFVESPDMMNIYNGNATLDASGETTITMPPWFDALNRDFRYQLTAIGGSSPNLYISQEMSTGSFKIAGGASEQKVSWQVTGIRQDAYANAHRIPVEEDKTSQERGTYLHPAVHGQPAEKSVTFNHSSGVPTK